MPSIKTTPFRFLNKVNVFDVLLYTSFIVCVLMSIFMERKELLYISPFVIITIFIKYISLVKKEIDILFVLALVALLFLNFLTFYSYQGGFELISILTSTYLMLFSLTLKKYLKKSSLKSMLSVSSFIAALLIGYLIFAVVNLLITHMPDSSIFYVFLSAFCLIIYVIVFSSIYLSDNYENGIVLLASGLSSIFHIGLSPINEYFFYTKTFTVIIIICHFASIILFMNFISKLGINKFKSQNEKPL